MEGDKPEEHPATKKLCPKCRRTRPITEFYRNRSRPDGRHNICRVCRLKEYHRLSYDGERYPRWWAIHTRVEHRRRGRKIIVSIDELAKLAYSTKHCMYCGIELAWNPRGDGLIHPDSPTLDRYDNENELNINNVRIICHPCNAGKGEDTYEDYVKRCRNVVRIHDQKGIVQS